MACGRRPTSCNKLATARKLDDQDNNKKPERKQNKHIKQIYKTIVFL
jgi:hypothetical protein